MKKSNVFVSILSKVLIILLGVASIWAIWSGITKVRADQKEVKEKLFFGQHYILKDSYGKAETYFKEVLAINNSDNDAKLGLASVYALQQRYGQAEKMVLEVIEERKGNAYAYQSLGLVQTGQRKMGEAREQFLKAKSLDKGNSQEYERLVEMGNQATAAKDDLGQANLDKAIAERIKGLSSKKYDEMAKDLGKTAEVYKIYASAVDNLERGAYDEAIKLITSLSSDLQENPMLLKALGMAYMVKMDAAKAEESLKKSYEKDRDEETAYLLAEVYLFKLQNKTNLTQDDEKLHKKYEDIQKDIAKIDEEITGVTGNDSKAKAKIEKLEQQKKKYTDKANLLNTEYAYGLIEKLVKNHSSYAPLQEKMAKCYYIYGDIDKAEKYIEQMLTRIESKPGNDYELLGIVKGLRLNQTSSGNADNSKTLLQLSEKLVSILNRKVPQRWLDQPHNKSWREFLVSYFRFNAMNMHIVNVDASKFPVVDAYIRFNGMKDKDKTFSQKDFILNDTGSLVKEFDVTRKINSDLSIIMLMDRSGSMQGERINKAKAAAVQFISNMNDQEKISFSTFSNDMEVLADFEGSRNKDKLIQAVDKVTANGGTNLYSSINKCLDNMKQRTERKAIVVLTDGEDGQTNMIPEVTRYAKELGVPVFSIGLGAGYKTLQQISYETGGEFYFADDSEKLVGMYDAIRKQLGKEYKVSFKVDEQQNQARRLKISMKNQDVWSTKAYRLGAQQDSSNLQGSKPQNSGGEADGILLPRDAVSPNLITRDAGLAAKTYVEIDMKGFELQNKSPEVYVNSLKVEDKKVELNGSTVRFQVPDYLPAGVYDVKLQNEKGDLYIGAKALTVREQQSVGAVRIGNMVLSGDVLGGTSDGLQQSEGDFKVNDQLDISGTMTIDQKNKAVFGNGSISIVSQGERIWLHRGEYRMDTTAQAISLSSGKESISKNFKLMLNKIQFKNNSIAVEGRINTRIGSFTTGWAPIESCVISPESIYLIVNSFSISTPTADIRNAKLTYEGAAWKGKGDIYIKADLNANAAGTFTIAADEKSGTNAIKEILLDFQQNQAFKLERAGISFIAQQGSIQNFQSSFPDLVLKGKAVFAKGVGGQPMEGDMELQKGANTEVIFKGNLSNKLAKMQIEKLSGKNYELIGRGTVEFENKVLGAVSGAGEIYLNQGNLYGTFNGKVGKQDPQAFEMTNDLVAVSAQGGVVSEVTFAGEILSNSNLKSMMEQGNLTSVTVPENMSKAVIQMTWKSGDTDFTLEGPGGSVKLTPENAAKQDAGYIKADKKAYYVIAKPAPGTWTLKPTTQNLGDYVAGLYSINNPPSVKVANVSYNSGNLEIKWEVKDDEDTPALDIYAFNEEKNEKVLLFKGLNAKQNENGYTFKPQVMRPGNYYIAVSADDQKNLPVYGFYEKPITILDPSVPQIAKIGKAYRMGKNVILEPVVDQQADLEGFRVYETDGKGNINVLKTADFRRTDKIVLQSPAPGAKYRIAGYNRRMEEGPLSEVIDASVLPEESALAMVTWMPESREVKSSEVALNLDFKQSSSANILVNGQAAFKDTKESRKYPVSLEEGGNEVIVQSQNKTTNLYDEKQKEYILDTKPPILYMDKNYSTILPKESLITLSGRTEAGAEITINEQVVKADETGNFLHPVRLKYGKNAIRITVRDKSGNSSQYAADISYYGNMNLNLAGGFGILYLVTIFGFVIAYKHKKRKLLDQKVA